MKSVWLQENSWKDVARYLKKDDRCLIPVGSTEQHGRFAPLGTDSYVAIALAEEAAKTTRILVAPPVWFGWSPHHMVRPGTISIRAEVLIELLFDMIESLARHGFKTVVVINGHRVVNIAWMQIAAQRAQEMLGVKVALFDPAYMSKEIGEELGFGPIGHAEEIEISHMMYAHPDLIDQDAIVDNPHSPRRLYHIDPRDSRDTLCYVPASPAEMAAVYDRTGDNVGGSPSRASAESGRRYHEHLVGRLVTVIEDLKAD